MPSSCPRVTKPVSIPWHNESALVGFVHKGNHDMLLGFSKGVAQKLFVVL